MPDTQFITSWLEGVVENKPKFDSGQNSPAVVYATPPVSTHYSATSIRRPPLAINTERRRMNMADHANVETPRAKRPKRGPTTVQSLSTDSISSLIDNPHQFSHPSQSEASNPSRSSSPKRDLLNQLRCASPSIDWQNAFIRSHRRLRFQGYSQKSQGKPSTSLSCDPRDNVPVSPESTTGNRSPFASTYFFIYPKKHKLNPLPTSANKRRTQ